MKCERCHKTFNPSLDRCPDCGAANPGVGVFQTSSILIAGRRGRQVYNSVEEVPDTLRSQLEKSTSGLNSATIVIADRRGRREIARALRKLPDSAHLRVLRAIAGGRGASGAGSRLTRRRKAAVLAALAALTLAVIFIVFMVHWA